MTVLAYVGMGANLGEPEATFRAAITALGALRRTQVLACSGCYRTAPVDAPGPDYLNAAIAIRTGLSPDDLLSELQAIENAHGRQRLAPNAPRTLDLDLLLYGDDRLSRPGLIVPHPRLASRAFVLRPLAEIAPDLVVPGVGSVGDLLAAVADQRIERL